MSSVGTSGPGKGKVILVLFPCPESFSTPPNPLVNVCPLVFSLLWTIQSDGMFVLFLLCLPDPLNLAQVHIHLLSRYGQP